MSGKSFKNAYSYRNSWIQLVRPLTLTGSISPAIAGTVLASRRGIAQPQVFLLFLLAALLVQMAINILNDYFDFLNGQDEEKWSKENNTKLTRTPSFWQLPFVASGMLVIAMFLGIWLAFQSTFWILVVGAISILAGIFYSAGKKSLAAIGAGELVAAIFLGFVVTILAYIVEGGGIDSTILAIALPYALLIASMILTNNIRDIEKDIGFRCTIAMSLGYQKAVWLLVTLVVLPYIWIFSLVALGLVGWKAIIVLFALPIAIRLRWKLRKAASPADVKSSMKWGAWHHWAFGLLFALGIWLG